MGSTLITRVADLINQYEACDDFMTAGDVLEELELIMDDELWDEPVSRPLQNAINAYILARHNYNRYGGHVDDGNDAFIGAIENIIDKFDL